jgi:hypothetical protein
MAFHYSPKTVTDGLIFQLDADNYKCYNNAKTQAYSIANGEPDTNFRRLDFLNVAPSDGVKLVDEGNFHAFEFDGTDEFLRAVGTPLQNIPANLTYASWFSHNRIGGQGSILFLSGPGANINRTWLYPFGNNINAAFTNGAGQFGITYNDFTASNYPNEYNYVVATCELEPTLTSSTLTIYVNGEQVSQITGVASVSGRPAGPNEPDIGRGASSGSQRFNGKIANTSIYNKALSQEEVLQNYNALKSKFGL